MFVSFENHGILYILFICMRLRKLSVHIVHKNERSAHALNWQRPA